MDNELYKRTKTGAVQRWEVKVEELADGTANIVKKSGQLDTKKPRIDIESVKTGKNIGRANETTPLKQAQLQAESDFKKKQDQGYKTAEQLGITWDDRHEDWVYNGQHYWRLDQAVEAALPTFNTDSQGRTKPMLAQTIKWDKVDYPCFTQPKLDGVRCLTFVQDGEVKFISRSGKEYSGLQHIAEELLNLVNENMILDGELYSHDLTFQEITSAVKKPNDNTPRIVYYVYDLVVNEQQSKRQKMLQSLVDCVQTNSVVLVPTNEAKDAEEAALHYQNYIRLNYEGMMIRLHQGLYEQGQRSWYLLKVKEFDSNEFTFKSWEYGQRGINDLIAVCKTDDGLIFKAKMQGSQADKQNLVEGPIADKLTVKHFGWTDEKLPRFPIGIAFRDYE